MKIHQCVAVLLLSAAVFACNRIEGKMGQLKDKATSKGQELMDTAVNQLLPDTPPDSFSISSIVKDFKGDEKVRGIKGIQVDNNLFYIEYVLYTGQKKRVLRGVNKIAPAKADYGSDESCYPVSATDFYENIASNEKNGNTQFFWNFERLSGYEIYTCVKAPLRHYIIFDKHSDTVYHRIEELR